MHELILHHYPLSPYSEKIRAMLGYTGLGWQSALTREMPPRPLLAPLAGGYRRIPVAQLGSDVFCDSRVIAAEVAALSGRSELAFEGCESQVQAHAGAVESDVFFACVIAGGTRKLNRKVRASMSTLDLLRFFWDRIDMGRKAKVKTVGFRGARPRVLEHLARIEDKLSCDFLFGSSPNYGDFATYHGLWFVRDMGQSSLVSRFPKTSGWMDRIKSFGEGRRREISGQDAIDIARSSTPRSISEQARTDSLIGRRVAIAPTDYGQIPTLGQLVGSTATRWIVAREGQGVGTIHVHFPKQGFALTPR